MIIIRSSALHLHLLFVIYLCYVYRRTTSAGSAADHSVLDPEISNTPATAARNEDTLLDQYMTTDTPSNDGMTHAPVLLSSLRKIFSLTVYSHIVYLPSNQVYVALGPFTPASNKRAIEMSPGTD